MIIVKIVLFKLIVINYVYIIVMILLFLFLLLVRLLFKIVRELSLRGIGLSMRVGRRIRWCLRG